MTSISLVIPVYNYATRVYKTIQKVEQFCTTNSQNSWEIIFVDDGSVDTTATAVQNLIRNYPYMKLITQGRNVGKGATVRKGLQSATGDFRIFMDCDLAYGMEEVEKIIQSLENGADFAYADRKHPHSTCMVAQEKHLYQQKRNSMSFVLHKIIQNLNIGPIRDTQAGLKGMRSSVIPLMKTCSIDGFPFDIELFAIAKENKLVVEPVPVNYHIENAPSTVMPIPVAFDFVKSIGIIRKNMLQGKYKVLA